MEYISTAELAKRWGVSVARILTLAKQGRLPGARLIGKSWIFPDTIERPEDRRRHGAGHDVPQPDFRFPIYHYTRYTSEELAHRFSEPERRLYTAEADFFAGRYQEAATQLEPLLRVADDPYVRFGALYCYCLSMLQLDRYRQACLSFRELQELYARETAHRKELELPIHDLETYFTGNRFYLERFAIHDPGDYPKHMRMYLLLESAYSDMLRAAIHRLPVNPLPYELCIETAGADLSPLSATLLHIYLAGIHHTQESVEAAARHLRRACLIAEANDLEHSIAFLMHYSPDIFTLALQAEAPAQLKRLQELSEEFIRALNGLFEYTEKYSILQELDTRDASLIQYAQKGLTHKEIAAITGLSMTTISKKYARLYEKTETHSKSELARLYSESMLEF